LGSVEARDVHQARTLRPPLRRPARWCPAAARSPGAATETAM